MQKDWIPTCFLSLLILKFYILLGIIPQRNQEWYVMKPLLLAAEKPHKNIQMKAFILLLR